MTRKRMIWVGAVALVLSLVVTAFAYRALATRLGGRNETVQVVAAAKRLTVGARLTADDVRLVEWPRAALLPGAFLKKTDVVGRGLVTPLLSGEPVLESKLAPQDGLAGFASAIPEGMRAVAVKVDEVIGVAGFVLPGTRVDVILSGLPDRRTGNEMGKVFLENVLVFATGQNADQEIGGKPQTTQVITLLVTPVDSQKVALAAADGNRIQLALRNPMDQQREDPVPVLREDLFRQASFRSPEPRPAAPRPRSIPKTVAVFLPAVEAPAPSPPPPPSLSPPPPPISVEVFEGVKKHSITFDGK